MFEKLNLVAGPALFVIAIFGLSNENKVAWANPPRGYVLIDVRSQDEYAEGHLPGAIHIPHDTIQQRISAYHLAKNTQIILYCASGHRSGLAQQALRRIGYTNVVNGGGIEDLQQKIGRKS